MLPLAKLASSVSDLAARAPDVAAAALARRALLRAAYERAREGHGALLERAARDRSTITWNIGLPLEPLGLGIPIARASAPYAIAAADGSSVEPDAHLNPDYYVLNVGTTRLVYGAGASAAIAQHPTLHSGIDHLFVGKGGSMRPKTAQDISLERDLAELEALVDIACSLPTDRPRVALVDGTLVHYDLEAAEEAQRKDFIARSLGAMDRLRDAGIPVAGYVAAPQSRELVNALRLVLCTYPQSRCAGCDATPCEAATGTTDAELLAEILHPGERGPILEPQSRLFERITEQRVLATSLHIGASVIRLEVPRWVVDDGLLDGLCGVLLDQVAKGAGYPPVLQEAHEAAVITMSDRTALLTWVENATHRPRRSAKATSKRLKRV